MKPNELNEKIGKYRWTICALVFFATTVNYLDRQVLSLLKDRLEVQFNWSDSDYANIVSVFQFVYAISMLFAGRLIDWLGTKWGYAWGLIVWSIGAMVHALAKGTGGFMFARGVLGFGESGNFPAAIKTVAEWFPKKERALATGIFNSGANVGAIIAPLTVPWIADHYGWEAAFLIIGGVGFFWLIFWFFLYEKPQLCKKLKKSEFDYINSDTDADVQNSVSDEKNTKNSWFKLLKYRQTWAFSIGKFLTDGVWWFFLFWLPAYLKAQYGMTGTQVALPLAVLYTMSTVGSITGGWFPMYFINKGYNPYSGRMKAMFTIALFPLIVLSAQFLGSYSYWLPIIVIGIGTAAHQAWSANIFTTVSDMFPKKSVASVIGIGGMAGGLGGIVISKAAGWMFDAYRAAGIAKSWAEAQASNLADFAEKIKAITLVNKNGEIIDLNRVELASLSKDLVNKIQAVDPNGFEQMKALQVSIIQGEISIAYAWVFGYCAIAYLLAWFIMKSLVPKFKEVSDY